MFNDNWNAIREAAIYKDIKVMNDRRHDSIKRFKTMTDEEKAGYDAKLQQINMSYQNALIRKTDVLKKSNLIENMVVNPIAEARENTRNITDESDLYHVADTVLMGGFAMAQLIPGVVEAEGVGSLLASGLEGVVSSSVKRIATNPKTLGEIAAWGGYETVKNEQLNGKEATPEEYVKNTMETALGFVAMHGASELVGGAIKSVAPAIGSRVLSTAEKIKAKAKAHKDNNVQMGEKVSISKTGQSVKDKMVNSINKISGRGKEAVQTHTNSITDELGEDATNLPEEHFNGVSLGKKGDKLPTTELNTTGEVKEPRLVITKRSRAVTNPQPLVGKYDKVGKRVKTGITKEDPYITKKARNKAYGRASKLTQFTTNYDRKIASQYVDYMENGTEGETILTVKQFRDKVKLDTRLELAKDTIKAYRKISLDEKYKGKKGLAGENLNSASLVMKDRSASLFLRTKEGIDADLFEALERLQSSTDGIHDFQSLAEELNTKGVSMSKMLQFPEKLDSLDLDKHTKEGTRFLSDYIKNSRGDNFRFEIRDTGDNTKKTLLEALEKIGFLGKHASEIVEHTGIDAPKKYALDLRSFDDIKDVHGYVDKMVNDAIKDRSMFSHEDFPNIKETIEDILTKAKNQELNGIEALNSWTNKQRLLGEHASLFTREGSETKPLSEEELLEWAKDEDNKLLIDKWRGDSKYFRPEDNSNIGKEADMSFNLMGKTFDLRTSSITDIAKDVGVDIKNKHALDMLAHEFRGVVYDKLGRESTLEAGTKDPTRLFEYYADKFNLSDDVHLVFDDDLKAYASYNTGNKAVTINKYLIGKHFRHHDFDNVVASNIRHELEHARDHANGTINEYSREGFKHGPIDVEVTPKMSPMEYWNKSASNHFNREDLRENKYEFSELLNVVEKGGTVKHIGQALREGEGVSKVNFDNDIELLKYLQNLRKHINLTTSAQGNRLKYQDVARRGFKGIDEFTDYIHKYGGNSLECGEYIKQSATKNGWLRTTGMTKEEYFNTISKHTQPNSFIHKNRYKIHTRGDGGASGVVTGSELEGSSKRPEGEYKEFKDTHSLTEKAIGDFKNAYRNLSPITTAKENGRLKHAVQLGKDAVYIGLMGGGGKWEAFSARISNNFAKLTAGDIDGKGFFKNSITSMPSAIGDMYKYNIHGFIFGNSGLLHLLMGEKIELFHKVKGLKEFAEKIDKSNGSPQSFLVARKQIRELGDLGHTKPSWITNREGAVDKALGSHGLGDLHIEHNAEVVVMEAMNEALNKYHTIEDVPKKGTSKMVLAMAGITDDEGLEKFREGLRSGYDNTTGAIDRTDISHKHNLVKDAIQQGIDYHSALPKQKAIRKVDREISAHMFLLKTVMDIANDHKNKIMYDYTKGMSPVLRDTPTSLKLASSIIGASIIAGVGYESQSDALHEVSKIGMGILNGHKKAIKELEGFSKEDMAVYIEDLLLRGTRRSATVNPAGALFQTNSGGTMLKAVVSTVDQGTALGAVENVAKTMMVSPVTDASKYMLLLNKYNKEKQKNFHIKNIKTKNAKARKKAKEEAEKRATKSLVTYINSDEYIMDAREMIPTIHDGIMANASRTKALLPHFENMLQS